MVCVLALGANLEGHCYLCAKKLTGRRTKWCSPECVKQWYVQHNWTGARKAAKRRDKYRCVKCASKEHLEVNHIVPLKKLGRSGNYGWGCHNHLDGLETLCRQCHVAVTKQQRKERNELSSTDSESS